MGPKKKSKKLLTIIILLIILILLIGVVYAYFATELFKSKKEIFFKYVAQLGNEQEGLMDNQLKQYFVKKNETPYQNEGSFHLEVEEDSEITGNYDVINKFNISFSGQTDKNLSAFEQEISLNYSDEVNFPITFRKVGDAIGFQTKYVGDKYVAIRTDDLEDKNYEDLEGIDELIQESKKLESLTQLPFSQEDWQRIQETYINVIETQLQETQFTKVEEDGNKGYQLKLNGQEVKNIVIKVLETLKNDQETLDKINEYLKAQKNSAKITANAIDNTIKDLERNENEEEENLTITIYQEKGKTTKLVVAINEVQIQLKKQKEQDMLQYEIILASLEENNEATITVTANYMGLNETQNVTENYEVKIDNYKYQLNNQISFGEGTNIEEFLDENAMILNNYEDEQVNNFIKQVIERFEQVNQKQMEELGLEDDENPLGQILMPVVPLISNQTMENSSFNEMETNEINQKFENYESTNLRGTTVKGLLTTIQAHNVTQEEHDKKIKEIHFDGEEYEVTNQNIAYLKDSVDVGKYYRVEFERDEDTGIIYRAVINKK